MTNKIIKITKEQYNRIFASKLLKENAEKSNKIDLKKEVIELINYFYGKTTEFSPTLAQLGVSYDEISNLLLDKKILVNKDGQYGVSNKLGTPENAKEIIEFELKKLIESKSTEIEEEAGNFPVGVDPHTSDAPWNQPEVGDEMEPEENRNVEINGPLETIASNYEISILTDGVNQYVFLYGDLSETPLSNEEISDFVSKHKEEVGYGLADWETGTKRFVQIDDELKNDLTSMYDKDNKIVSALNSGNSLEEVTSTASSGRFTGLFSGSFANDSEDPENKKSSVPVVKEVTAGSQSVGAYDANALPGIGRDGSYKTPAKSNAEKKTQYAGGSFVSMDDCTKLNNNKSAQNGGCSTGAVDNVVKLNKTSGNVNAPSLKSGK